MSRLCPRIQDIRPLLGADPEFFFKDANGNIIGAEKVIPKEGLKVGYNKKSNIIIDGVQAELNPTPYTCRQGLRDEIAMCLRDLQVELSIKGLKVVTDFSQAVEISKENLMELSESSRRFGCAPSESIYENSGVDITKVDPMEYRIRAAGGHIHIGYGDSPQLKKALLENYTRVVQLLDIICGNTCVLVDRNPANIERRKVYGRAGEFRRPPHGLEYRTLSNFWLTAYPLMSLAFGLARLAVQIVADEKNSEEAYKAFMSAVKLEDVQTAINTNDYDLAMKNFQAVFPIIVDAIISNKAYGNESYPIDHLRLPDFLWFAEQIKEHGLKRFFPQSPMHYWSTAPSEFRGGFNEYLRVTIQPMRLKWEEEQKKLKVEVKKVTKVKKVASKKPTKLGIEIVYATTTAKKPAAKRTRKAVAA